MAKGYNRINYLKQCKIIIDIVNKHYHEGYTTYAGIFRTFIEPYYPMHYNSFMKIINMPSVEKQLEHECDKVEKEKNDNPTNLNQLELFK